MGDSYHKYSDQQILVYILDEIRLKEQLNRVICCDFTLESLYKNAMLVERTGNDRGIYE